MITNKPTSRLENSPAPAAGPVYDLPRQGKMRVPVRIFASPRLPLQPEQAAALAQLAQLEGVRQVVALPDLHIKPNLEAPSSLAVGLSDHIALGLSSPSPNCGMALARTGLHLDDLTPERVDHLFRRLAGRLPLSPVPLSPVGPTLSAGAVVDILVRGGQAALEMYDLPPQTLAHMEQQGNALSDLLTGDAAELAVRQAVPPALIEAGRWRFGQVGKGNHFLELQVVTETPDPETAQAWGLEPGSVVAMYHADSGLLGAFVGRLYAHRIKNTWKGRLYEWRIKLPHHILRGGLARLPYRLAYHLWPRRLALLPASSAEAQRAWLALQAASNYAYANRLAVLAELGKAVRETWGAALEAPSLLWDAPHNSIRREKVGQQELWVHRHNAARVEPPSLAAPGSPFYATGQPVLLPGTERTISYLCVAGEGAAASLHSADHGAGRSAVQLAQPMPGGAVTRVYGYDGGDPEERPHLTSTGVEEVMGVLHGAAIAHPVAVLKPLAVLKA